MPETKPALKLKLPMKPRTLSLSLSDKVKVEKKSEDKVALPIPELKTEVGSTPPKVWKGKNCTKHKIVEPKLYFKILKHFQTKYPNCFCRPAKPLAIGIFKEVVSECEELSVSQAELKCFFKAYCKNRTYRQLVIEGVQRVDLQGSPTSVVTENSTITAKIPNKEYS